MSRDKLLNKNIMKIILYTALSFTILAPTLASACLENLGRYGGYGMMGYGGGMGTFMVAGGLVWTAVGILACVWLWQNINKK